MSHPAPLQHVPILLVDVADFTSKYDGVERKRALLRHVQEILTASARFFMPYGDVWAKWHRHGTGDGYYFLFDALPPQVALKYALDMGEALARFNDEHPDLGIRLRQTLVVGDVEWVGDQILSDAFAGAERLISYKPFKDYCGRREEPATVAISDLFHHELLENLAKGSPFEGLAELDWKKFEAIDKHGKRHPGYVLGEGWDEAEEATAEDAADVAAGGPGTPLTPGEVTCLRLLREECNRLPLADDRRDVTAEKVRRPGRDRPALARVYVDLETTAAPSVEVVFDRLGVPADERPAIVEKLAARVGGAGGRRALDGGDEAPLAAEQLLKLGGEKLDDEHPLRPWVKGKEALAAASARLTALEALLRHRALVLLGDPGSGKSTLVNHLAAALASRCLHEEGDPLETPSGPFEGGFPVRLTLRRWSAGLRREDVEEGPKLRLLGGALAELSDEVPRERWHQRFRDPRTVVLFDGLDEVPAGAGEDGGEPFDRRRLIVEAVAAFRTAFPECRVLVTCRVKPYRESGYQVPELPAFELAPLDDGRIERFCERWYDEMAAVRRLRADEAADRRERLLRALGERRVLREMAGTPLLLTMLARVNQRAVLPDSRAELYGECVEQLLWEWERQKSEGGVESLARLLEEPTTKGGGTALQRVDFERVLWRLTYDAHGRSGKNGTADLPAGALREALAKIHPRQHQGWAWADKILTLMRERGGLLIETAPGAFTFPHRSFQEYLACRWLLESGEAPETAGRLAVDDAWSEVILLSCGHLKARGPFGDLQAIVAELVAGEAPGEPAEWLRILVAGRAWREFDPRRATGRVGEDLRAKIPELLTRMMQHADLPPAQRREAGLIAADLGWLPEDLDAWVEIPADRLDYGFKIGKYPVTNAQYRRFVEAGGYDRERGWFSEEGQREILKWWNEWPADSRFADDPDYNRATQPVTGVSWYEAMAYAAWLTAELREQGEIGPDEVVRLPTVAEWERAAGGVEKRKYSWEGEFDPQRTNTEESGLGRPSPVHMYPGGATPDGIFDLTGNVWEWTLSEGSPKGWWELGGGAWYNDSDGVGAAARGGFARRFRIDDLGFRWVVVPISRSS